MRGTEREQPTMFSHVALEDRIPADHPLRTIRPVMNRALGTLSATFDQIYGWFKTIGLCRQTRFRGVDRVGWMVTFATAVYNLVRMRNLLPAAT